MEHKVVLWWEVTDARKYLFELDGMVYILYLKRSHLIHM
jgi:hypothetical protein